MKKNEGITLIALIITIIILIILTAVTINNVIGTDLIGFATKAVENYTDAAKDEEKVMKKAMALSAGKATAEDSKVQPGEPVTSETEKQEEGEITYNYTDVMGRHAMVPEGFKVSTEVSEQFVEDGLVIQDEEENEFVWVPCKEEEYKSHSYSSEHVKDEGNNIPDTEGGWNTWYYGAYNDWTEDTTQKETNIENIKKYEGFYIARYEAGVPNNAEFYVNKDTINTKEYAKDKNKIDDLKPISKKGVQAWNLINQKNAKEVSKNMYNGESSVKSQLVDGIAWDRIVEWIISSPEYIDITKDSKKYGNYANNQEIVVNNTLWAEHLCEISNGGVFGNGIWRLGKKYQYSQFKSGYTDNYTYLQDASSKYNDYNENATPSDRYIHYVEMATGASESTKLKNIYDMAGNLYEWTTETGEHNNSSENVYVSCRGGGFNVYSNSDTICIRNGAFEALGISVFCGFRVVLYIQ